MKKHLVLIILISVFLILLVIFGILVKTGKLKNLAATNNAILALSPASGNYITNNTFPVDIIINTSNQPTVGTDIYLNFNPLDLAVVDADTVTTGIQIQPNPVTTLYSQVLWNSVDNTTGKIIYMASVAGAESPYTSSVTGGIVARITFQAKRVVTAPVTFKFTLGAGDDSNVVLAGTAGTDILGVVTNGSYNLVPPDVPTTVKFQLEGRPNNAVTTDTIIEVRSAGQVVFQKNDLITNAAGTGTLTLSGLAEGKYDFKIKVNHWLSKSLINIQLVGPLTLDYGLLKGGDINSPTDNQINGGDFAYLKQKLTTTDSVADINQDGTVNVLDFSFIYQNWGQSGT